MIPHNLPFLSRYFLLFTQKLLLKLLLDNQIDKLKIGYAENGNHVKFLKTIAKRRHIAIAHPTRVIKLISGNCVLINEKILSFGKRARILKFPHIETIQKQFASLEHVMQLVLTRFIIFTEYKIDNTLFIKKKFKKFFFFRIFGNFLRKYFCY